MTIGEIFLTELKHEAASTRKVLERVPFDKASWKPHEKSMDLAGLSQHIADLFGWIYFAIAKDELDFAKFQKEAPARSTEELLNLFDSKVSQAEQVLATVTDEEMMKPWTLRRGDHIIFTMPKRSVVRFFSANHIIHHRGQLTVYLRLLNVAVPGCYGPSADEQ